MDKRALECYLMIGSTEPVIDWLRNEGVNTKKEAANKLSGLLGGIALTTFFSGASNSSAFDSADKTVNRIVNTFPNDRKEQIIIELNEFEEQVKCLVSETNLLRDKLNVLKLELNEYLTFEEVFREWCYPEKGTNFDNIRDLKRNCPLLYAHVEGYECNRHQTYYIFDNGLFRFVDALADPGIWDNDEEMEDFINVGESVSEAKERILALCKEIYDNKLFSYKNDW